MVNVKKLGNLQPRYVPNSFLRSGMTVWKPGRNGSFIPDCILGKPFLTSPRFPEIAFHSGAHIVVFSNCGHAWVTYT